MNVEALLRPRLSDAQLTCLATGIVTGYAAAEAVASARVFDLAPGATLRGYLVGPCVQMALDDEAKRTRTFEVQLRTGVGRNCHFFDLTSPGVVISTHFMGIRAQRHGAHKALYRAQVASRTCDLFADEAGIAPVASDETLYAHLMHGGWGQPTSAWLNLPDRAQSSYPLPSMLLDLPAPSFDQVEEVRERFTFEIAQHGIEALIDRHAKR